MCADRKAKVNNKNEVVYSLVIPDEVFIRKQLVKLRNLIMIQPLISCASQKPIL